MSGCFFETQCSIAIDVSFASACQIS